MSKRNHKCGQGHGCPEGNWEEELRSLLHLLRADGHPVKMEPKSKQRLLEMLESRLTKQRA